MPEDVRTCTLCGSDRSASFDHRSFRGRDVNNRVCLDCGLVYQSPRMTEAESAVFYTEEYRMLNEGSASPTARNIATQHARAEALMGFARPMVQKVTRALDIGCSMGILLRRFEEIYACHLVGIEPSEAHRNHACKEGLTVYATLDDLEKAGEARFDLVSMSHVLEHLPDPVGYLNDLRDSVLTPEGWLLIEVPNLYAHDSFEVAHLFAFSLHILREVLRKGGFVVVKFEQHGQPNSQILPLFLTVLCHPVAQSDKSPVRPEKGVALKRRIGMVRRHFLELLYPKQAWLQ